MSQKKCGLVGELALVAPGILLAVAMWVWWIEGARILMQLVF